MCCKLFKCSSTVGSSLLQLLKQALAAVNSRSNSTKIHSNTKQNVRLTNWIVAICSENCSCCYCRCWSATGYKAKIFARAWRITAWAMATVCGIMQHVYHDNVVSSSPCSSFSFISDCTLTQRLGELTWLPMAIFLVVVALSHRSSRCHCHYCHYNDCCCSLPVCPTVLSHSLASWRAGSFCCWTA